MRRRDSAQPLDHLRLRPTTTICLSKSENSAFVCNRMNIFVKVIFAQLASCLNTGKKLVDDATYATYRQWLKCTIKGGGTLHSGVGP